MRWSGVANICMAAGNMIWAIDSRLATVSIYSGRDDATFCGRLKVANIVNPSRTTNGTKLATGIARAELFPNVLANWLSLYSDSPTFTADTVPNFDQVDVVVLAGRSKLQDEAVSRALAVKYVPP